MPRLLKNIFGMKIKRLTDLIADQGREAFWQTGIDLDAKLTSVVVALYENGSATSSELAEQIGLSRQLIEKRLRVLEESGYIESGINKTDARKRSYRIAAQRKAEAERVVSTMRDFEKVYEQLWAEVGVDLGTAIVKLESALRINPLLSRLCRLFPRYGDRAEQRVTGN